MLGKVDAPEIQLGAAVVGEQQAFGKFEVSPMAVDPAQGSPTGQYLAPDLPSPQDWVLVLEKIRNEQ